LNNFGEAILERGELKNTGIAKAMASIFKEVYLQKRPPERGFILLSLLRGRKLIKKFYF